MRVLTTIILLCSVSCQPAEPGPHPVIERQQARISELEAELEAQRCAVPCDMMEAQIKHATIESSVWKEIAENCVSDTLEVQVR